MEYAFTNDLRRVCALHPSFFALAQQTFGLEFAPWSAAGHWTDAYRPYAFYAGDQVAACVAVNRMEYRLDGRPFLCVQLGTVMTHPAHRGKGLARRLLEAAIQDWRSQAELLFLYANDTVLDFYPRFGFRVAKETAFVRPLTGGSFAGRPVDMADASQCERVWATVARSCPQARLWQRNAEALLHFYLDGPFCDSLYFCGDALVVATQEEGWLCLHGVFAPEPVDCRALADCLAGPQTRGVRLGFTPLCAEGFIRVGGKEADATLFILEGKGRWDEGLCFPALSHA